MAKSKPIGVRFDLDKLDMIQKEQNLTSVQQVVNFLMDNYGSNEVKRGAPFKNMPPYDVKGSNLADNTKVIQVPAKEKEAKNEPKEGSLAWFMKNS
jgi:hypothetical protein